MKHEEIRAAIRQISPGSVRTYSDITPDACAVVGRVQNQEPDGWHRVVYGDGTVKTERQRMLLMKDGVKFTADGRVDLAAHRQPTNRA